MLSATIDHVLIHAADLDDATRRYTAAGFTVTAGGRHPGYTHNALVSFADGSYLELIATYTEPPPDEARYWQRYGLDGGLFGYALGVPSVEQAVSELRESGLAVA